MHNQNQIHPLAQIKLISEREIKTRLASKGFVISMIILLLLIFASTFITGIIGQNNDSPSVTVAVPESDVEKLRLDDFPFIDTVEVEDVAAAQTLVADETVEAAIYATESSLTNPVGVAITVVAEVPGLLMETFTYQPTVTYLEAGEDGSFDFVGYFLALAFGIVFFVTAMTFGNTIVQSVVEEKQTRIIEILLATVKPRVLLTGKVIGNSILALLTVVIAVILATLGMVLTGQDILLGTIGAPLIWFGVLFIFGFILVATLYAATAALASRYEDATAVTMPVMMLIMIPYILVIMFFDNDTVLTIMSYVPFSAPVGMPMRLFYGTAAWWEPLLSLTIILATSVLVAWLGAKIYEGSILRTGKRVKLSEALKSQ